MTVPLIQDYTRRTPEQIVKDLNAAHDLVRSVRKDSDSKIKNLKSQLQREKIKSGALSGLIGALLWKGVEAILPKLPLFFHLFR